MSSWQSLLPSLAALIILLPRVAQTAPQDQSGTANISLPQAGDTVRGLVQIQGTAIHPDFNHYLVEFGFQPNPDDQWFPVQDRVAQQVQDGPLAVWDTTVIADGTYQLRLRVVSNDGQAAEFITSNVTVSNAVATQPPTIVPSATPSATAGIPTPGPSPTPLIQQPPTHTPRPTATPGGPTLTPTPNPAPVLDPRMLRGAACRGVGLTLLASALVVGYAVLRQRARADIRRWWKEFRRDALNRRDGGRS